MVVFGEDSFTITVKSNAPAEEYRDINRSLILLTQDGKEMDSEANYWVLELLNAMSMEVEQLEKIAEGSSEKRSKREH